MLRYQLLNFDAEIENNLCLSLNSELLLEMKSNVLTAPTIAGQDLRFEEQKGWQKPEIHSPGRKAGQIRRRSQGTLPTLENKIIEIISTDSHS